MKKTSVILIVLLSAVSILSAADTLKKQDPMTFRSETASVPGDRPVFTDRRDIEGTDAVTEVQIGDGTVTAEHIPMEPYYGYTYSQVIYTAAEIGGSGTITQIKYQYNGYETFTDDIVVYMAETSKAQFTGDTDWLDYSSLTKVYDGTYSVSNSAGWYTITLDTPFSYSNTQNLLIAFEENTPGYHGSESEFFCTATSEPRSLYFYDDVTNPDPVSPPAAAWGYSIANIILAMDDMSGGGSVESEPNDTWQNADLLALDASMNASINVDGDGQDWFRVTIPYDGELTLSVTPVSGQDMSVYLYDYNGSSYISACTTCGGSGAVDILTKSQLAEGYYYILVSASGDGDYTIAASFTPSTFYDGNDAEPNDMWIDALTLDTSGPLTGHLNYFGNGTYDTRDRYKITLDYDAALRIIAAPDATLNTNLYFYDSDSMSYISGCTVCNAEGVADTLFVGNMKAGTYYLGVEGYGYGGYALLAEVENADFTVPDDTEPNDSWKDALVLMPIDGRSGHMNYFGNSMTDSRDQYLVTLPFDGALTLSIEPMNDILNGTMLFYDTDTASYITGCTVCGGAGAPDTLKYPNLKAGTYGLRLEGYGYGAYWLESAYVPSLYGVNDETEPNNSNETAQVMNLNSSLHANGGYYGSGSTDDQDNFSVVIPGTGTFTVAATPTEDLNTQLSLYSSAGSYLTGQTHSGNTGQPDSLVYEIAEAGTYIIKVSIYGYGSYLLQNASGTITPGVVADFTADVNSGEAPLTVNFTSTSSGTGLTYSWDLDGDGSEDATVANPTFEYTSAGDYTVSLTVTDSNSAADTETKTNFISVSDPAVGGGGWTDVDSDTYNTLLNVDFPTADVGYAVGYNKTIVKTTDGGLTWTSIMDNVSYKYLYDVQFLDANTGFVSGSDGIVLKTSDGGTTWQDISLPVTYYAMFTVDFESASVGYVSGNSGKRYKTVDGGASWVELGSGSDNIKDTYITGSMYDFQVGYMNIYRSGDGGDTWSSYVTCDQTGDYLKSITFSDANSGFAVGYNYDLSPDEGFMYTSGDGGATWTRGHVMIDNDFMDLAFVTENLGFLVSNVKFGDGVVYKTVDGGLNWAADTSQSSDVNAVAVAGGDAVIVVGESGLIMRHQLPTAPPEGPVADFTADVLSGPAPLTVGFTSTSTGDIVTHEWDFNGDGVMDEDNPNPSHTFTDPGDYTVSLKVIASDGSSDVETRMNYITVYGDLPPVEAGAWTWLNPTTGGHSVYDMQFLSADLGYAACTNGHMMKTLDGGSTWVTIPVDDQGRDFYTLEMVTANTGYIGGSNGMLYRTTDGAVSGGPVANPFNYDIYDLWFFDAQNGFAVGSQGKVSKTADGGATWTAVSTPAGTNYLRGIYFKDADNGFICGGSYSSASFLMMTSDGGATWTAVTVPVTYELKTILFTDANTGYAAGYWGRMIKTTDGGSTWTEVGTSVYETVYGMYFSDSDHGFLAAEDGIFATSDGAATFTRPVDSSSLDNYCIAFADADHGYVSGYSGHILETTNGGTDWELSNSAGGESLYAIDFLDADHAAAAGSYGTVFLTDDGGASWFSSKTNRDYNYYWDVVYPTADVILVCGDYGEVMKSSDGGLTWTGKSTSSSSTLYALSAPAPNVVYASGYGGKVTKSIDGGTTWTAVNPPYDRYFRDVHFTDALNGWVAGGEYGVTKVFRTSDGGVSWTEVVTPGTKEAQKIYVHDASKIFIIGDDGMILLSTDDGSSWSSVGPSTYTDLNDIAFISATEGYAAGDYGEVYRTLDGGYSWELLENTSDKYYYGVYNMNGLLYFVGMGGAILSYDPGSTPVPLTANFTASPLSGNAPLDVQFTSLSTGNITRYSWDLNGDQVEDSNEPNPFFTYTAAGSYSVSLTVYSGDTAMVSESKWNYITVSEAPIPLEADFTADVTRGPAPLTVTFTDISTGTVLNWLWNFGDGYTSTDQHPEHTYTYPGVYDVSLTVTNSSEQNTLVNEKMITVTRIQPIALKKGWNWFSMNLDPMSPRPDSVLASISGSGSMLKSQTRYASFNGPGNNWLGELDTLHRGEMFMLKMTQDDSLFVEGVPFMENVSIDVDSGWNWIGYTLNENAGLNSTMMYANMFSVFIKSQFGFAYYYPEYGWYGSLNTLEKGQGYKLLANSVGSFTYRQPAKSDRPMAVIPKADTDKYPVDAYSCSSNMSVVGHAELPGGLEMKEGMTVLAMAGEEIRGAAAVHESPFGSGLIFTMTVYGNGNESLDLRIMDSDIAVGSIPAALTFSADALMGDAVNPVSFTMTVTGLDENYLPETYVLKQNYPNPFNPVTSIEYGLPERAEVTLTIYSITGQKVRTLVSDEQAAGWHSVRWDARNDAGLKMSTGIYICRIQARGDGSSYTKVIKMAYLK